MGTIVLYSQTLTPEGEVDPPVEVMTVRVQYGLSGVSTAPPVTGDMGGLRVSIWSEFKWDKISTAVV